MIDSEARHLGKVSFYNKWKGYGFLELAQPNVVPENKVFVHWRNIQSEDRFPFLVKDMDVEFSIVKLREGRPSWNGPTPLRAKAVSMPGGTNIVVQDTVDAEKKTFVGGQAKRYPGTCKFYDHKKGFGYVSLDAGLIAEEGVPTELRVERTEVNCAGKQPMTMQNVQVEFGIWKTKNGGYKAYNMTFPGGAPITQNALEHRSEAGSTAYSGEVRIWNWQQGWGFIKLELQDGGILAEAIQKKLTEQTEAAQQRATKRGKPGTQDDLIYFRKSDVKPGAKLRPGIKVIFQLYTDDKGVGACGIEAIEPPEGPPSEPPPAAAPATV